MKFSKKYLERSKLNNLVVGKFKLHTLTFMLFIFPFLLLSQTDELACGFNDDLALSFIPASPFSHSIDPAVLYAKEPKVFRVKFWQVNKFNGQFGDGPIDELGIEVEEVLAAISNLNRSFNKYNLFFKYNGLDQINSPETVYLKEANQTTGSCEFVVDGQGNNIVDIDGFNTINNNCQANQFTGYLQSNGYIPNENINVFLPYDIHEFRAVGSYSPPRIIIKRDDLRNKILIHEMGHALYLFHTHQGHRDLNDPLSTTYTDCEHVTRDDTDINYNAEGKGDIIIDTAAVPDFLFEHYYEQLENGATEPFVFERYKYIDGECLYSGTGKDCLDDDYDVFPKDSQNPMAYIKTDCRSDFTIGQAIRMHEIVELDPSTYNQTLADLPDLFEPYTGEYYLAGPQTENAPLFQPGFEYRFVECEGDYPAPADYGTIFSYNINTVLLSIANDETDFSAITHPNHTAIHIKHEYGDFLNKPEKCYNNWNRKPSGGKITKFNDNTFNTNVTITPKDSTSINDQNLIQNLSNGLYRIEKNYEDGAIQETVIIKGNN